MIASNPAKGQEYIPGLYEKPGISKKEEHNKIISSL